MNNVRLLLDNIGFQQFFKNQTKKWNEINITEQNQQFVPLYMHCSLQKTQKPVVSQ